MKHINLLWTGGWDSTFRLCQLSFKAVEVQPVYFIFNDADDRTNCKKEIEAQEKILPLLRQKPHTQAIIHAPIRLTKNDLPQDEAFDAAFETWRESGKIPGQLHLIGKLPLLYPNLEYCMEGPTLKRRKAGYKIGKTHQFLLEHGFRIKFNADGSTVMNTEHADPGLRLLFGRFTYPILGITETDMLPMIRQWGYEDIFKKTWTCDFGGDEPCGVCHNCETKWASGLAHFFDDTPNAIRNHAIKLHLESLEKKGFFKNDPMHFGTSMPVPKLFTNYVKNGYCVIDPFSILTLPYWMQRGAAAYRKLCNARAQDYFDRLIRNYDQEQTKEVI